MPTQNLSIYFDAVGNSTLLSIAQSILSVINYPNQLDGRLSQSLQHVENLIPYLKIVNPSNLPVWTKWESEIPALIKVAKNVEPDSIPKSSDNKRNPWFGKFSTYKINLLAAISQPINNLADREYVYPALAVLFAAYRSKQLKGVDEDEITNINNLCDFVRKAVEGKAQIDLLKRYIPPLNLSENTFWLHSAKIIEKPELSFISTHRLDIPAAVNSIVYLYRDLWILEPDFNPDKKLPRRFENSVQHLMSLKSINELNENLDTDVLLVPPATIFADPLQGPGSFKRNRLKLNLYQKHKADSNSDLEGIAPLTTKVEVVEDTHAQEPMQLALVQLLDVRYTNYRTAMDNQYLPWSWDCLNRFEILELIKVLKVYPKSENESEMDNRAAFLTWLMLLTGLGIEQILGLNLFNCPSHQSALISGGIFRRYIHRPPHSFMPNDQQNIGLSAHSNFINLLLPKTFSHFVNSLVMNDFKEGPSNKYQNISSFFNLSEESAEQDIRQFLLKHKNRNYRFSIGRVRNVLAAEVMRITNDPVIVHLLTSIPSDMPPSGVYYTSFSEDVLCHIYEEATKNILKDLSEK